MRAGRMRQRVTVQLNSREQDSYGEEAPSWADVVTVWAEVRPSLATARERMALEGDVLQARAPYQVRLRHLAGLSPVNHRLVWTEDGAARTLEIEAVMDPDGKRAEMVCMCWEAAQEGTIALSDAPRLDFSDETNSQYAWLLAEEMVLWG